MFIRRLLRIVATRRKLVVVVCFLCVLQEAWVSQVDFHEIPHDWEHSLEHAPVIVVARQAGSPELYREWVFPRATHYERKEETVARESVQPYEVLEVIRADPNRPLNPGQRIDVWREPEYGRSELEHYHRTGIIHSPLILLKQAAAAIVDGRVLLFLTPHEEVWSYFNGSPEEGEALLERRPGR
ncbi:MAG: hypothetical protein EA382_18145 [Spirochaetaceae bacterium]|nr:MAG: hypothetical protein EA382_18145 [Spirochaetaceae bacterium]